MERGFSPFSVWEKGGDGVAEGHEGGLQRESIWLFKINTDSRLRENDSK